jgi:hypothetical protein
MLEDDAQEQGRGGGGGSLSDDGDAISGTLKKGERENRLTDIVLDGVEQRSDPAITVIAVVGHVPQVDAHSIAGELKKGGKACMDKMSENDAGGQQQGGWEQMGHRPQTLSR